MERRTGFIFKPTQPGQWVVGSKKASTRFGATSLMPGGHGWLDYLPTTELQAKNGIETSACTVFASLKAWAILAKRHGFNLPDNFSERFSAIMAGVYPPGANPHDVAESIRRWGMIAEARLPFDKSITTIGAFYSPKPMDETLVAEAREMLELYEPGHEYIFNGYASNKPALLKAALERGTVCVSVYAWKQNGEYYYKDSTDTDSHWVTLIDYEEGDHWLISDQYKPFIKKVAWNTDFQTAELYFLKVNTTGIAPNDRSYFDRALRKLRETIIRLLKLTS